MILSDATYLNDCPPILFYVLKSCLIFTDTSFYYLRKGLQMTTPVQCFHIDEYIYIVGIYNCQ